MTIEDAEHGHANETLVSTGRAVIRTRIVTLVLVLSLRLQHDVGEGGIAIFTWIIGLVRCGRE